MDKNLKEELCEHYPQLAGIIAPCNDSAVLYKLKEELDDYFQPSVYSIYANVYREPKTINEFIDEYLKWHRNWFCIPSQEFAKARLEEINPEFLDDVPWIKIDYDALANSYYGDYAYDGENFAFLN